MYNLMEEARALQDLTFLLEHYDTLISIPNQLSKILTQFRLGQKDLKNKFSFPNATLVLMARYFYEREKLNCKDPEKNKQNARAALLTWVQSVADPVQKIMTAPERDTAEVRLDTAEDIGQKKNYQNGKNIILSRNYIIPPYDKTIAIDQAISDAISAAPLPVYGADSYPNVKLKNGFVESVTAEETCSEETAVFWKAQYYRLCQLEADSQNTRNPKEQERTPIKMCYEEKVEATMMLMIWYAQKLSDMEPQQNDITMIPITKAYLQKALSHSISADNSFNQWILDYKAVIKLIPAPNNESSYLIGIRFADPQQITLPESEMELPDLRYFDYGIRAHSDNQFCGITLSMLSEVTAKMPDYVFSFQHHMVHFRIRPKEKDADRTIPEEKYEDLKKQIKQAIIGKMSGKWQKELQKNAYAFACQLIAAGACNKDSIFVCPSRMQCFSCDESKFIQYQKDISEFESPSIERSMPEQEK